LKLKERFRVATNNHLELYGVDLVKLSNKFGTPLFVFDEKLFRQNYRRFLRTFQKNYQKTIICYSIKTNYNLTLCRIMQQEGAYAEVASGLDLHVAKRAGFQADRIILDGLYKSARTLREATRYKINLINVESFSEMERINKIAGEMGVKQSVGIRVNLYRKRMSFKSMYKSLYCHPDSRFGFSIDTAYLVFRRASKFENLQITGILTHPYYETIASLPKLCSLIKRIQSELGIELQYINFGGGFRSTWSISPIDLIKDFFRQKIGLKSKLDKEKKSTDIEKISALIANTLKKRLTDMPEPSIVFEPGHNLVNDAGLLLLRVGCIKEASGCKWIVVDGGTNLIPIYTERRELIVANRASAPPAETVNVVGPLLYGMDFIAIKTRLPRIKEGDLLAVLNSGAYTMSFSTQFLYPRPPVVLLDHNAEIKVIRDKETYEDVVHLEKVA